MNLEFVYYDYFTPHLLQMKIDFEELEKKIHVPHMPPFEDDGAHCEDDID